MTVKERFESLVDRLATVESFGTAQHTITFTQSEAGTYDPVTGKKTGGTTTVYTAKGWFTGYKLGQFPDWQAGDTVFIIKQADLVDSGSNTYTPKISDRPAIDNKSFNVVDIMDDKAGGDAGGGVTYKLHLRGG